MRQSVVRAAVRASSVSARRPIVVETLEIRQLLSGATTQAILPVLRQLESSAPFKSTHAQLFNSVNGVAAAKNSETQHVLANAFSAFTLDLTDLKATLATAPFEFTAGAAEKPLSLSLPMPDGTYSRFQIVETSVMEPGLAAQFPDIKTYRGVGIDDPTASVRLDHTMLGFHAQVLSTKGSYYIDPYYLNDADGTYISYFKKDNVDPAAANWSCDGALTSADKTLDPETEAKLDRIFDDSTAVGTTPLSITFAGTLKTYRAAVSANHQYSAAVGSGLVANTQAAIVTAVNRVTGVYETELSIRLTLVANNSSLIFTSASGDPWTANDGSWLNTATTTMNGLMGGSANYDIGHEFTTGSGGVAFLGCVGTTSKAGGTTGLPTPTGDSFYIDYVAHEMGHQFGANHTFNTSRDSSNRSDAHAYEPGSGSTIMGYAGIEAEEDLQAHSDPYFHSDSIDAIRTFITNTIPSVGTSSSVSNVAPVVNAGLDYTIPTGTPFALTASATDANGDTITYDWQERDLGAGTAGILMTTADAAGANQPLFRVWSPTTNPTRSLPQLSSILAGTNVTNNSASPSRPVERLYAVARTSNWRVIARDNKLGGGGVSTDDMVLSVVNTGASFSVTAPNTAISATGGAGLNVTWNVAGTTGSGINTANVKISLSTDGGNTFPTVLTASTANDGTETLTLPNISTTTARIKVEAVGNVFFDIGNTNFTIAAATNSATPGVPDLVTSSDTGFSSTDNLTLLNNANGSSTMQFSVGSTVAGASVSVLADGVVIGTATATGTTTIVTTSGSQPLGNGARSITATQTESGKPVSAASGALSVTVDATAPTAPAAPALFASSDSGISNSDGITNISASVLSVTSTDTYFRLERDGVQVSGNYIPSGGIADSSLPDGTYSYRARAVDAAGNASVLSPVLSVTIDTVAPAAPTAPTLAAASDTGASSTDGITKINTPTINSTSTDTYYRLERDGSQISGNFAAPGSLLDTTLVDETYVYRSRSVDAAGNASGLSGPLSVTIDTVAPQLVSQQYSYLTSQSIALVFNDLVNNPALDQNSVVVSNLTTPGSVTAGDLTVAYDNGLNKLIVTWPSLPGGVLPDGNYTATLSSAVADVAGNAVTGIVPLSFYFLQGDATQDRFVDTQDFNVLAGNFGNVGTFADGNFNYDGTIDSIDFTAMVGNFGKRLAAPAPLASTSSQAPAGALFGNSPVTDSPTLAELN